jgi:hypothetical protein
VPQGDLMPASQKTDEELAKELIDIALNEKALNGEFKDFTLIGALGKLSLESQGSPLGRVEVLGLAEDAVRRAVIQLLGAERGFPTGLARDTIAAARKENFNILERAKELLS